jgi:BTB/POZ domain
MIMKGTEEEVKKRRDNVELILKLNLRGTIFSTAKDTLRSFNNTYCIILLSSPTFELDGNGEFFIDRCSNGFDRLCKYWCTGV